MWRAIDTIMDLEESSLDDREAQFQAELQNRNAARRWFDRVSSASVMLGKYSQHYGRSIQNLSAAQTEQIAFWLWERDQGRGLLPDSDSEADYIDGMIVLQWLIRVWMQQEVCLYGMNGCVMA